MDYATKYPRQYRWKRTRKGILASRKYIKGWRERHKKEALAQQRKYHKKWRDEHRAQIHVYHLVAWAIKKGKLIRPNKCERCGKKCFPHAHHHNGYEHPLDVMFVCYACHGELHHPLPPL